MMKVLLDYRMVTWSGIGRYSQELARALHERDDIELCLIKTKDNQLPIELTDVSYFDAGAHPLSSKGFRELRMATRSFVPDLLHCTHISTPNLKGLVSSEGKKIPVVTTLHDLTPIIVDGVMPSFAKRAIYSGLNQRAVNWSSALITPSQHTIGDLEKYFPKIACPITAIPLAADELLKVEPVKPSAMNYLSPVFQRNFLLSFGNTKPHKDLPTLFAAFEQVAAGHDDISLLLVGKEPPNYLRQHNSSDLLDRVQFTGPISDEELVWLYQRARAFVFPSLYEGFGLPPLEAMSFGCPVIVADTTSLPEVVDDAGVKVAPKDVQGFAGAITRVLKDEEHTQDLEDRGLERSKEFSWEKVAHATVSVYKSVYNGI